MSHTPQYKKLLIEPEYGILRKVERKILEALLRAPDGLTRPELIRIISGREPKPDLNYDSQDRALRKGVGDLQKRGVMITSTSRKAGYKLDADPETIQCMLRELRSRIARLQKRVHSIESIHLPLSNK